MAYRLSRNNRGLVHFSAQSRRVNRKTLTENMDLTPLPLTVQTVSSATRRFSVNNSLTVTVAWTVSPGRTGALKRFSRMALPSTKTLESAMAPAASIGDSSVPLIG